MDSLLMARIDQILEERNGRITNHELAQILNYDGSYIGRIVKKATGKSLFKYSMTFTMAAAETVLCSTQMSISQITEKLNFSNRALLYKVFDQYYHMTPKQYQEKLRNKTLDI
ncbi:helix-turn-helix domain-containing protein [Bariatricus sp. HCP28S3_A4]|uniref:helix-turn-helix domain-containing protein n=2 Tax=Bariatricus TaxID=1924081 RepID=UPI003F8A78D0